MTDHEFVQLAMLLACVVLGGGVLLAAAIDTAAKRWRNSR